MRLLLTLLIAGGLAAVVVGTATAGRSPSDRRVQAVVRDCADNHRLDRRHDLVTLRRARRNLPADVREYTRCDAVLARAIARRTGRSTRRFAPDRVRAVMIDCTDGAVDRRFRTRTLRRALRHLPADIRTYTRCEAAIRKALRKRA